MNDSCQPLLQERPPTFKQARSMTLQENYDPAAYPPDLHFASEHAQSQKLGQYIPPLEDVLRCRCCLQPIHKKQLPLTCQLSQLFHCGASTPLYFQFIKQCILLLGFNLAIIGLPSFLINYTQGQQCNQSAQALISTVCKGSIINIMNVRIIDAMQMQSALFFVAVLLNIVFIGFLELKMDLLTSWYNSGQLKAVDYSILVKGLPLDTTISDIQKYLEEKMVSAGAPDRTVTKIYIIYNFKNYLRILHKKQELSQKNISLYHHIQRLQYQNLNSSNYQKKLTLQKKRTQKQDKIKQNNLVLDKVDNDICIFQQATKVIHQRISQGGALEDDSTRKVSNFSGKCIITLNSRKSQQAILEKHAQISFWQRIVYSFRELLQNPQSQIIISRAPEPQDIIFANMGAKRTIIWKNRILYSLLIFFLLCLDFLIVALARKFIHEEKAIQKQSIIFSFINAMIVSLFCSLFRKIIRASQGDSYYNTYSRQSYKVVQEMVLVFMINMLFTTFAANVASFYLVKQDKPTFQAFPLNFNAFLYDCFFLIATNPVFSTLLVIFDHRHIRNLIKKYRINQHHIAVSQGEANKSFENIHFDICHKTSTIYRFVIFTAGITILYPLSIAICMAALLALFWVDKWLLLRRYSVTVKLTARFTVMAQTILAQFPIYLSITTLLVMFIPFEDGSAFQGTKYTKIFYYLSGISLALSLLNYWAGYSWMKRFMRVLLKVKDREEEEQFPQYRYIETDLVSDYSHHYPYFRISNRPAQKQQEQLSPSKQAGTQQMGTFDSLKQYMSEHRYT